MILEILRVILFTFLGVGGGIFANLGRGGIFANRPLKNDQIFEKFMKNWHELQHFPLIFIYEYGQ